MDKKKLLLSATAILLLSACDGATKKTLGLTEDMPDELQVKRTKPLEVPPHLDQSQTTSRNAPDTKTSDDKLSEAERAVIREVEEKNRSAQKPARSNTPAALEDAKVNAQEPAATRNAENAAGIEEEAKN